MWGGNSCSPIQLPKSLLPPPPSIPSRRKCTIKALGNSVNECAWFRLFRYGGGGRAAAGFPPPLTISTSEKVAKGKFVRGSDIG